MKSKKTLSKLIALGGISFFILNACSPNVESPEQVISQFKQEVKNIKTADVSFDISMKGDDAGDKIDLVIDADAKMDRQDEAERKLALEIDLSGELNAGGNSMKGDLGIHTLSDGEDFFFNLLKFDSTDPSTEKFEVLMQPYMETWQHLGNEFLPEELKLFQKVDEESLKKEDELKDLFAQTKLFEVTKEYGIENLDGRKVYHFGVKLNKGGVKDYIQKASSINGTELTAEEVELKAAFVESVTNIEMFIGAKDYLLYKGVLQLSGQSPDNGVTTDIDLVYVANEYNKDVNVEAPGEYEEFNPLSLLMSMQLNDTAVEETNLDQAMPADPESTLPTDEMILEEAPVDSAEVAQ